MSHCSRKMRVDQDTGEILQFRINTRKDKEGSSSSSNENNGLDGAKFQQGGTNVPATRNFEGFWLRSDRDFYGHMLKLDLPRNERRVLDALMFKVRFGNFVELSYSQIDGMTGIAKSHISEAMTALVEKDIVVRLKRGQYLLNPLYCYMGEGDGRANMIGRYYDERGKQGLGKKARKRGP